jgi:hypothetical protein
MSTYTIRVTPNDDSGASASLVVDTTGEQIRITDIHLHSDGGLADGQLPSIDFALLLQAVTPGRSAALTSHPSDHLARTRPHNTGEPATSPIAGDESEPPGPAEAEEPAPTTPTGRRRRRRATTEPSSRRTGSLKMSSRATQRATVVQDSGGRAYRRMPEDLARVYQELSSPSAVASHYDVPRHTAQGWIRRLKTVAGNG